MLLTGETEASKQRDCDGEEVEMFLVVIGMEEAAL